MEKYAEFLKARGCVYHHEAWARGYLSRKPDKDGNYGYLVPYTGIFGKGYKWYQPSYHSTRYHRVSYYLEVEKK